MKARRGASLVPCALPGGCSANGDGGHESGEDHVGGVDNTSAQDVAVDADVDFDAVKDAAPLMAED